MFFSRKSKRQDSAPQKSKNTASVLEKSSHISKVIQDSYRLLNIFESIDSKKRDRNVEAIVKQAMKNQNMYSATKACLAESKIVPELQKPAYLSAAAYCSLYIDNDLNKATEYALSCLQQLDCFSKDDIVVNIYQWLKREDILSWRLFDEKGFTRLAGNPYLEESSASEIDVENLPNTLKERIGHVAIGLQIALVSGRLTDMPNNDKAIWENGSLLLAYLEDLKIIDSQKSMEVVNSFSRSYPNKDEGRECNRWMTDSVSFYKVELLRFLKGDHKLPDVIVYNVTHHSKEKVDFNNLPILGMDMFKITQTWAVIKNVFDTCFYNQKENIAKMPVDTMGVNSYQAEDPYPEIKREIKKELSKKMQDTFPWLERNCIDDKKFARILEHITIAVIKNDKQFRSFNTKDLLVMIMKGLKINTLGDSNIALISGYVFLWLRYVCLNNIVFYRNILSVCFNEDTMLKKKSERREYSEGRLLGLSIPDSQLDDIYLILKGYMDVVFTIGKIACDLGDNYSDKQEVFLLMIKTKYKETEFIKETLDTNEIAEVVMRDLFIGKKLSDVN